ncbi:MAG: hypothetical protein KDD62_05730 [Bdellovibrionales bacterium]|nr:hypothetical protein [Bdellovibrionales bacterium]
MSWLDSIDGDTAVVCYGTEPNSLTAVVEYAQLLRVIDVESMTIRLTLIKMAAEERARRNS